MFTPQEIKYLWGPEWNLKDWDKNKPSQPSNGDDFAKDKYEQPIDFVDPYISILYIIYPNIRIQLQKYVINMQ